MRLTGIVLYRKVGEEGRLPVVMDAAIDVSDHSYWKRGAAREGFMFITRAIADKVDPGALLSLNHEDYVCYTVSQADGLVGIAVADREYPDRVAISCLRSVLATFAELHAYSVWSRGVSDYCCRIPTLEATLAEYQTPDKVDKIMRVRAELEEVHRLMHENITRVLERGDKLEDLALRSADLSESSKMFLKAAKKANTSCCVIS